MPTAGSTLADYPELLAEWHPEQEPPGGIPAATVPAQWKREARWACSQNPSHKWTAGIRARVRWLTDGSKPGGKGACPWCWEAPRSVPADGLAAELRERFVFNVDDHKIECFGKVLDVDIIIPSMGGRSIIIEFDGAHWRHCAQAGCIHDGETSCRHNRDIKKSRALEAMPCQKYRVIRVREAPLDAGQEKWKRHRHWVYVPRQLNSAASEVMLKRVLAEIDSIGGFRPLSARSWQSQGSLAASCPSSPAGGRLTRTCY